MVGLIAGHGQRQGDAEGMDMRPLRHSLFFFLLIAFVAALGACGGGGSSSQTAASPDNGISTIGGGGATSTSKLSPGGYWTGTITLDAKSYSAAAIIDESGSAVFMNLDTGAVVASTHLLSPGNPVTSDAMTVFDGSLPAMQMMGSMMGGGMMGSAPPVASFSGTVAERSRLTGTFTFPHDATQMPFSVDMHYMAGVYEQGAALSDIVGTWSGMSSYGQMMSITINSDGSLYGQDEDGCIFEDMMGDVSGPYNSYGSMDSMMGDVMCGSYSGNFHVMMTEYTDPDTGQRVLVMGMGGDSFGLFAHLHP
jgi:hypothetical protein